jgi:hypothetical protein
MKICGTSNNMPFSKLIRSALGEKSSHLILIFSNGIAIQSNPIGIHTVWDKTFRLHNQIHWEIDVQTTTYQEFDIIKNIMDDHDEEDYDWLAFIYYAFCLLKMLLFKIPIPKENLWQRENASLCVALPSKTPKWFLGNMSESILEMASPDSLEIPIREELTKRGFKIS